MTNQLLFYVIFPPIFIYLLIKVTNQHK